MGLCVLIKLQEKMKQIISIHVGQAGVQIGNSCWQLFCHEHGIGKDGKILSDTNCQFSQTFFSQSSSGKLTPRSLLVDLQPTVIDEVKTGGYKQLFNPNHMICGKEDAASNFIRGQYTMGREYIEECLNKIRKLSEQCDNLEGFFIFNSTGGTGGGFGSLILERLSVEMGKKSKFGFTLAPSPRMSNSIVEPYNAIFTFHKLIEYTDVDLIFDNEALYEILAQKLDVESPNYTNVNRLIAQSVSSLTSSMRFGGPLNFDMEKIKTNLINYPRTHFLISSLAPLIPADNQHLLQPTVDEIVNECFESESMMTKCNPRHGKYTGCSLMFKGNVTPKQVINSICKIKNNSTINFVDWLPNGFKVGISSQSSSAIPAGDIAYTKASGCMVANQTAIAEIFSRMDHKFDLMYQKRAFVHWFLGQGIQSGYFPEARENMAALEKDYDGYWEDFGFGEGEQQEQ